MELTEGKVYNFNTMVQGQGFGFSIVADSREDAIVKLHSRLQEIVNELQTLMNQKKASSSN